MGQEQKKDNKLDKNNKSQGQKYYFAHGRRKEATARVKLFQGQSETLVNNKPIEKYFPQEASKIEYLRPFHLTGTQGKYYAIIKVEGSGNAGQLGAVVHGISRALKSADEKHHLILKKAGLLTRDSRIKERRKYGLAQKARKGKQSPKR